MKTHIFTAALLGAVGTFSAIDQASMEMDSWCITYLSTYLAPVSNQASAFTSTDREAEEPTAQDSGRLPFVPSVRPTFGRSTSIPMTRSTLSDDGQGTLTLDTSFVSVQSTGTSPVSPISVETSDLNVEPTGVPTDELATSSTLIQDLGSTASTDIFPTSSSMNQPAGRSIILLVSISDNERRGLHKRATGGFVGIDNPDICTFAAVFTLVEGQLFDGGVPVYYSGEDFKDLAGQDIPSGDSITKTFTTSREYLVFRNSGLPNGNAGFCQVSDGQVYITFTAGPPGCVPVNLAVYDLEQCQDGRLIGGANLTSISSEAVTSKTVIPQAISSESVTSIEGTSAVEETQPIESESEGLFIPTSTIQSEPFDPVSQTPGSVDQTSQTSGSTDPDSQTSESGTSVMASSGGTDVSARISSFTTTIPTTETATAQPSIILSTSDDSSTEEASSSTEIEDSTLLASTSTDLTGSSTIPGVETTILSTLDMTSETTSSIEMSSIDATTTSEAETITTSEPETTTTDVTTDADTTTNTDTTTTKDQSTTENPTATEDTTSAAPIPTFANLACSEVSSPYEDPSGVSFDILCNNQPRAYFPLENTLVNSFTACIRLCAEDTRCAGLQYLRNILVCATFLNSFDGYEEATNNDVALRIPEDGNQITTTGDIATAEDPTTTADTTTAALSTATAADPVPPFVEATCNEVSSPYDDPIGVSFEILCDYAAYGVNLIDAPSGDVFTACVRFCALNDQCAVTYFDRPASLCLLFSDFDGSFPDPQFDGAIRISGDGNGVTTDDQTPTENPVTIADINANIIADTTADTIADATTAAASTVTVAATTL